jgi:hypothetical protein
MIKLMQDFIAHLQKEPIPLQFEYEGVIYKGEAVPIPATCVDGMCSELEVTINDQHIGIIKKMTNNWKIDGAEDPKFVDTIGEQIQEWFEG